MKLESFCYQRLAICVFVCVYAGAGCVSEQANPFEYNTFQVEVDDEKWDRMFYHLPDTHLTLEQLFRTFMDKVYHLIYREFLH